MHDTSKRRAPAWAIPLATAGPIMVILAIIALHALKPEFHPSWRFVSEYAIGPGGWIMQLAFVAWAASCVALALLVQGTVRDRRGRIGVGVLMAVGGALVVAGLFPSDPVTASPSEGTTAGMMHALASMIGIPGLPLAAVLITSSLGRGAHDAASPTAIVRGTAHAAWLSLLAMVLYLAWAVPRAGGFTADVWAGWMNRLVVAAYLAWQLSLARHLARHLTRRARRDVAPSLA